MIETANILVPVDFSTASRNTVRAVKKLAHDPVRITLLHIYDPLAYSSGVTMVDPLATQQLVENHQKRLRNALLEIRRTELDGIRNVGVELECTALFSVAGAICQFIKCK